MKVLADTSIWVEFFRKHPQLSQKSLQAFSLLLEEKQVVTIHPIEAEALSGSIAPSQESFIRSFFEMLEHVDIDWNLKSIWKKIIDLAYSARRNSISIPGVVDRMILITAQELNLTLWTLDRALQKLAEIQKVKLYSGD